jgi:hypothetical protein
MLQVISGINKNVEQFQYLFSRNVLINLFSAAREIYDIVTSKSFLLG